MKPLKDFVLTYLVPLVLVLPSHFVLKRYYDCSTGDWQWWVIVIGIVSSCWVLFGMLYIKKYRKIIRGLIEALNEERRNNGA